MDPHASNGFSISNFLRRFYVFPSAGYAVFPDTRGYATYEDVPNDNTPELESQSPEKTWVIDFANFGTTYAAVPAFLGSQPPRRVDICIPDQIDWPPSLRSKLNARESVHAAGPAIVPLGIAKYLCRGLQHWADGFANFGDVYAGLLFGSTLRLSRLTEDPRDLDFTIHPNKALGKPGVFLSSKELASLWGLDESDMPPTVPYTSLRRLNQIASDIILVSLSDDAGVANGAAPALVFKSSTTKPSRIYHELKNLMTMPPKETIMGRPQYLVTIPTLETICGFLMTYYPGGDLSEILLERRLAGTLKMSQQLSWARQLTSSLIHVRDSPAKFYSDLRMDQIVLSAQPDGSELATLLDFEQSRNIYNWAPPEIYYLEWIAELGNDEYARCDDLPQETTEKFGALLDRYLASRDHPLPLTATPQRYDNPDVGWYWPWLTSRAAEREAGMVYMLGKALWCILEGTGDADVVLGRSSLNDGQPRFPEFLRTPPALRDLVQRCTAGAREWLDGPIKIYRRGGKVFPLAKSGKEEDAEASFEETKEAVRSFWRGEMGKAEEFIEARMRYDRGEASEGDIAVLHYLRRPTLDEVLAALEQADADLSEL